jgi:translation initiation factor IF-1
MAKKNDHISMDGEITQATGYENFRVTLDNGIEIAATPSGKVRLHHIKLIPGDKVRVEMSPYDLTRGRIVHRYRL